MEYYLHLEGQSLLRAYQELLKRIESYNKKLFIRVFPIKIPYLATDKFNIKMRWYRYKKIKAL